MALLASVSNSLKVWNFEDHNLNLLAECNFLEKDIQLTCVTWNHNQQVVAVAGNRPNIYLVQASTGQILSSLPFNVEDTLIGGVNCLSFSHNSRYLASTNNSNAIIWDLKRRSIRTILEGHTSNIRSLIFAPDGILLTGDQNGSLRAWNVDRNTSTADLSHKSLHQSLNCIQLSPSAKQLATGYDDGSLTLWSMDSISPTGHISCLHLDGITSLSYSPKNEKLLASSGKDGNIHLTDVSSQSPSPAMSISTSEIVNTISFHESSLYISAGTENGNILLYDWRNAKKPIIQIPSYNHHSIRCVVFQKLVKAASTSHTKPHNFHSPVNNKSSSSVDETKSIIISPTTLEKDIAELNDSEISSIDFHNQSKGGEKSVSSEISESVHKLSVDTASIVEGQIAQNQVIPTGKESLLESDLQPVTHAELAEELQLLRYDIHQDLHGILREQVRQFAIAKVWLFLFTVHDFLERYGGNNREAFVEIGRFIR